MEETLKRLLDAELQAEARVEEADEARRLMIQQALDETRKQLEEFEQQVEARRRPFLATAEEGAQRRVEEMQQDGLRRQHALREQAAANELQAVSTALALVLGEE